MNKLSQIAWLASVLLLACGGVSRGGSGTSSNAGASGAASSSGVGGSSAGVSSSGGEAAAHAMNCDEVPLPPHRPYCARDCSADPADALPLECVAGKWDCPPGLVPEWSCPPGACARRYDQACCDGTTGHGTSPECGSDGMARCPPDFSVTNYGDLCLPNTVVAERCGLLQGTACSSLDYECHQGRACGATNCTCAADGAGLLVWNCATNPC